MNNLFDTPRRAHAYEGKEPYIFISYAHQDVSRVNEYIDGFSKAGFRIWFDEGVFTGASWPENRARHIIDSEVVLCFLSNDAVSSFEILDELRFAKSMKKEIVNVFLEDCELSPALEMKLSLLRKYHVRTPKTDDDIIKALCNSSILQKCRKPMMLNDENYYSFTYDIMVDAFKQNRDNQKIFAKNLEISDIRKMVELMDNRAHADAREVFQTRIAGRFSQIKDNVPDGNDLHSLMFILRRDRDLTSTEPIVEQTE